VAAKELQAALKADPKLAEAALHLGRVELERGRTKEAVAALEKATALAPKSAAAACDLGVAYESAGNVKRGVEQCRKALILKPDYAKAHHRLALMLVKQKQCAAAKAELEAYLKSVADQKKRKEIETKFPACK
jgi:Flp pilus assembly protein TadD